MTNENKTLKAARAYVARGLHVFPLVGKVPTTEHGVKDASGVITQIEEWFPRVRNIAIAVPPGVVVVDVDPRNGGQETFDAWCAEHGKEWAEDAAVPRAHTGAGGLHLWFQYPGGRLKKNPGPGVDLLTHGRYVVAPPSTTIDTYRWATTLPADLVELPGLPEWLLALAAAPEPPSFDGERPRRDVGAADALNEAAHRMTSWPQLLTRHGWTEVGEHKWRHPGSTNPLSATIKHDCLFVYSPNTPFPVTEPGDPHGVTLFAAIETLDYHGDRSACARGLRDAGHLPDCRPGVDPAEYIASLARQAAPAATHAAGVTLRNFSDVAVRRVRWLWEGRIPVSSLTLLAGREGEGKSTIAFDLMASITRGVLPGEYHGRPRDVVIVATEDSLEHTIKPRLLAARADITRVWRVDMNESAESLSLPVHIPDLEAALNEHDVALIVLDPLLSRLSVKLDSHKDSEVRQALEPLGALADRVGAAILGLIHLNKSGSTDPLQAVMASRAFTAFARSVLFAMVDPDDESGRHLLGQVKSNLGAQQPTLTYTFGSVIVGHDDGDIVASKIVWGPESMTSVFDALQVVPEDKTALSDACEWLRDWLDYNGGSGMAAQITRDGKAAGHAERTLRRARERLGIEKEQLGFPRKVFWHYPNAPIRPTEPGAHPLAV